MGLTRSLAARLRYLPLHGKALPSQVGSHSDFLSPLHCYVRNSASSEIYNFREIRFLSTSFVACDPSFASSNSAQTTRSSSCLPRHFRTRVFFSSSSKGEDAGNGASEGPSRMTSGENFITNLRDKHEDDRRDAEEGGFQISRGDKEEGEVEDKDPHPHPHQLNYVSGDHLEGLYYFADSYDEELDIITEAYIPPDQPFVQSIHELENWYADPDKCYDEAEIYGDDYEDSDEDSDEYYDEAEIYGDEYEDSDEDSDEYYDEAKLYGEKDDYGEDYEYDSAEDTDVDDHSEEGISISDGYQGVNKFQEDEEDGRNENPGLSDSDDDGSDSDSDSDSDDELEFDSKSLKTSFAKAMKPQLLEEEETSVYDDLAETIDTDGMDMVVVDINRTCKVTKGGGIFRYAVLILVGNGKGLIGYGLGKSHEVQPAMNKAHRKALRNLFYIDRYEGHTIYHGITEYYGKTKVTLRPAPTGTGLKASDLCCEIMTLCGIKNIHCKVQGSRNLANTIKAVFKALATIRSAEEIGNARGRYVEAIL